MAHWWTRYAAIAMAIVILPSAIACSSVTSADPVTIELAGLNAAVVPAVGSAGFFSASHGGLFCAQGAPRFGVAEMAGGLMTFWRRYLRRASGLQGREDARTPTPLGPQAREDAMRVGWL